ncbi:hypothetical protein P3T76_016464 [Phytophthora citrophthora]|uniref:Uncharacterized protein n=1 Tax=Phytophthora citrophthora TaxID=4793 RepID=A0AAD9LAC7_9STRA|nr:hypothetical protein P3T76_016464 [Phytophthora citrophthora]
MREKGVWWRGVATRWLVYPPVTRVTRVQFPDGKLLFAPTCSSALLLFCSSALLPPPTLLLFCSSALLFFAAFFPAVRAPQPTSLMLPTHSWRIGTSAAVESDSPTRTKIDTCTAPYSSLVDEMREKRVWWRGVATRIGRGCGRKVFGGAEWRRGVQFPDGKLLFAPTCSSALLLPPALLPPPTLLLFCSSALLFFAAFFPAVRAPQPTSLMLPTHSWRIGTSAAVESDSPTRTKIDTCTAPYSSLVEDAGERCLVARSGDEDWSRMREKGVWWRGVATRIGRGCGRKVFGGAEWRRGYGRARVVVCVGGGRSIGRGCGRKVFGGAEWRRGLVEDAGETCLVARSGDEDWSRMREKGVWWRGVATRIGRGCGRKVFGGAEWRRGLVEDAGETCLVARSGDEGMVERVWSLVEDAGETCLVARSGDEGMVERVWSLVEDAGETCLVARSGDEGMVERVWSLVEDAGETCLVARSGDEGMVERVWSCV